MCPFKAWAGWSSGLYCYPVIVNVISFSLGDENYSQSSVFLPEVAHHRQIADDNVSGIFVAIGKDILNVIDWDSYTKVITQVLICQSKNDGTYLIDLFFYTSTSCLN